MIWGTFDNIEKYSRDSVVFKLIEIKYSNGIEVLAIFEVLRMYFILFGESLMNESGSVNPISACHISWVLQKDKLP